MFVFKLLDALEGQRRAVARNREYRKPLLSSGVRGGSSQPAASKLGDDGADRNGAFRRKHFRRLEYFVVDVQRRPHAGDTSGSMI